MSKVNLDALIPREDFDIRDTVHGSGARKDTISINDLKGKEFFYSALRKPDFQRETNEWDSNKICELIGCFLEGDLIPAVILWKSSTGLIFVIDGSHRLSALAAWVNDDYGDGEISRHFYEGIIPDDQVEIADRTRKLIKRRYGSMRDLQLSREHPDKVKPEIAARATSLAGLAIQVQWVEGDSSKAESSFFKINQQASPIDKTEFKVLKARKQPNGIAARAIIRSGKGHKYWSAFSEENQTKIQEIAREINTMLFEPELDNPIKTLDLPIAGKMYAAQSLPLILEFINIVNEVPGDNELAVDTTGEQTIQYLEKCNKVVRRINSMHSTSLGLHPIVYFYSSYGQHRKASFLAVTALILGLESSNGFRAFTGVRARFEEFLLTSAYLVQQIFRNARSALAGYREVKDFYMECINLLGENSTIQAGELIDEMLKQESWKNLTKSVDQAENPTIKFSQRIQSAIYIRDSLLGAPRCGICGARIHKNSIHFDHRNRIQDGGTGSIGNGQPSHPYCNNVYKG